MIQKLQDKLYHEKFEKFIEVIFERDDVSTVCCLHEKRYILVEATRFSFQLCK